MGSMIATPELEQIIGGVAVEAAPLNPTALSDVMAALMAGSVPDVHWMLGDDLCDCTFQRVGEWSNPYLAETLRVRMCCIWKEIYKQYPQHVMEVPAYYDENRHKWTTEPHPWDSTEMDMPLYMWYRQLAKTEGKELADVRKDYSELGHMRPKRIAEAVLDQPSDEEVAAARLSRLRLTGWID